MFTKNGPWIAVISLLVVALSAWGCGGDDSGRDGDGGSQGELIVSAAASLQESFTAYAEQFEGADVSLSFAGSDELAAQIRQGVTPDVYAAANTTIPAELHDEGLVEEPVEFIANRLVIAVPADSEIESVEDLTAPGVTIGIGSEGVPIGDYTREILSGLPSGQADAILANVRTEEPDVKGVIGKVAQGAVDAGFTYVTDVTATGGELKVVELPEQLQPSVAYGAAVVTEADNPDAATEFIEGLVAGAGAEALAEAGFEPAPE